MTQLDFECFQRYLKLQTKNLFVFNGELVWYLGSLGETRLFKNNSRVTRVSKKFLSYPKKIMLADKHGNKFTVDIENLI